MVLGTSSVFAQSNPEDHVAELGVMFWKPSPTLMLSTDTLIDAGVNEVDFVEEFAIPDTYFPEFRASIGRNHKFRTGFVTFTYEEETVITRTIRFQGRTFNIGAPAIADINWKLYRFGYEWEFVSGRDGYLSLVTDLKYNRVEASIDSPVLTAAATTDVTAPIPTLGVAGRGYLAPALSVTGEFTAMKMGWQDDELKFFDFDLYGTVNFGRNVGVVGGYRSVVARYLLDGDSGDLKMKGLYFGALVRF
jgi:hypothetical protein